MFLSQFTSGAVAVIIAASGAHSPSSSSSSSTRYYYRSCAIEQLNSMPVFACTDPVIIQSNPASDSSPLGADPSGWKCVSTQKTNADGRLLLYCKSVFGQHKIVMGDFLK